MSRLKILIYNNFRYILDIEHLKFMLYSIALLVVN